MEPDDIRASWVPEGSWSRAWEPQQRWLSSVLSLCRGDQAIRMGFVLCGWMCMEPQFQLQLNTSFAPLECHFALNLGVSPRALVVLCCLLSSSTLEQDGRKRLFQPGIGLMPIHGRNGVEPGTAQMSFL